MTLQNLLVYPAFRGLGWLAVAACFVLVGVVGMCIISHLMFSLGRKSSLYKKRQPTKGWNKRFYPAALLMILFLLSLGFWLRSHL
jgi:uncharacterized membrane protein